MYYKLNNGRQSGYNKRFFEACKQHWPQFAVNDNIAEHYLLKAKYFDTAKFDAGYTNLNEFTLEDRFKPFVPTRMNNCTQVANSYGIDYAWPLLDVKLIEFFLSIPTEFKFSKRMGRYFHRKAVEEYVPKGVNWKQSKYMGEKALSEKKGRPKLNDGLHPDISLFADTEKCRKDLLQIPEMDFVDIKLMNIRRQASTINILDSWLKKFYPNGANWQNTPQ